MSAIADVITGADTASWELRPASPDGVADAVLVELETDALSSEQARGSKGSGIDISVHDSRRSTHQSGQVVEGQHVALQTVDFSRQNVVDCYCHHWSVGDLTGLIPMWF